jgi:DNA-binding transcriptional LysR family regulator
LKIAMKTLANLESFVRSAEALSFSAAARRLSLTPAALSRNIATLERSLGIRLFHRSTRKLALTEAGERFFVSIRDDLQRLQDAVAAASGEAATPAGLLKVSMNLTFGMDFILPILPAFRENYPDIRLDWHFGNRQVDLIAEGVDAAIGAGFELSSSVVARTLAPAHIIAVAAPAYLAGNGAPSLPEDLARFDGILMRSTANGRIRQWTLRTRDGRQALASQPDAVVFTDPAAIAAAAAAGLGVALLAMPVALPYLERGALVRVLPEWWSEAGPISLYYSSRALQPRKTAAFVDAVITHFSRHDLGRRFSAIP